MLVFKLRGLVLNVILSAESNLLLALSFPLLERVSALYAALLFELGFVHLELMDLLHTCLALQLRISNELNFFFVVVALDRTCTRVRCRKRCKTRGLGGKGVVLVLALHLDPAIQSKAVLRLHLRIISGRWLVRIHLLLFVSVLDLLRLFSRRANSKRHVFS